MRADIMLDIDLEKDFCGKIEALMAGEFSRRAKEYFVDALAGDWDREDIVSLLKDIRNKAESSLDVDLLIIHLFMEIIRDRESRIEISWAGELPDDRLCRVPLESRSKLDIECENNNISIIVDNGSMWIDVSQA